jgi:pimeloyl-ACP methyl ester carboxylesterase
VIKEAGGSAYVYGTSSGGALALEAANQGLDITKLALFEVPYVVDDSRPPIPPDYLIRLRGLVAANRRSAAVKYFMTKGVRLPVAIVGLMPLTPAWSKLKGVANTLPYDAELVADNQQGRPLPATRWAAVTVPTIVIAGGKSPIGMRNAMDALADVLPDTQHRTLPGQTHIVKAKALAPVLADFFS